MWQEVNSTRQMFDLGEEQVFGYTEPVDAKLMWLIVGYVSTQELVYCCQLMNLCNAAF